ncbi:serine protease 27-like [Mauremys reevesii]|uniref:serine protease 27-like n=1 Tax=Mauremys reevesii TaxID=260615 RepID=UPI00193F8ED0|nr:serine protease 27-like [Mauremys reevesii]
MMGGLCSQLAALLLLLVLPSPAHGAEESQDQPVFSRIIGGQDAQEGIWPWQVSVQKYDKREYYHICGGSLISAQWVVSAAHCFHPSTPVSAYRMNLGEHQLSNPSPTRISSPVRRIVRHPDYNPSTVIADIALVQLTEPVAFTDTIRPVSLPGPSTQSPAGEKCWVTGWGRIGWGCGDVLPPPRTLQQLQASLVDASTCETLLGSCKLWNQPTMLCARAQDARSGPCKGDSGGPLVCPKGNSFILTGIVSWGINCTGSTPRPGVYTWVSVYAEWIQEVTGSAGPLAFSPAVLLLAGLLLPAL